MVWLSPAERDEMIGVLRDLLTSLAGNGPAPGRSPHLVSAIFFPTVEPPDAQPS